ncbi:MAG TPA: tyrosine-type recombinase/integrase, partial [Acidimicrobiales bacterium]|nr:tyrosine-type recombinase/integrase [Acidimicrobiales bacterium]
MSGPAAARRPRPARAVVPSKWQAVHAEAPDLAATMLAYLDQVAVSLRPQTVKAVEADLRIFAGFVLGYDPALSCAADLDRSHIEAFKLWQQAQRGPAGAPIKSSTFRRRLGVLRIFFVRITEWGWPDAPARLPVFFGDVPKRQEPLPRFLGDGDFARFMRALAAEPQLHRRVAVELLARTGMRVGELCDLEDDAVTRIGEAYWLRIPLGKLRNDRYVPLHPHLAELIGDYQRAYGPHAHGRLLSGAHGPLNRYAVQRWLDAIAKRAGIGHVHPHRLRHTLATQAINRGMPIEAIAALLGHRSLDMTRQYARISNRVVAEEYNAVSAKVEALYQGTALPAEAEGPNMRRLRAENRRLLGNGWCERPAELDCSFESICESCAHFATGPSFKRALLRQRN